MLSACPRLPPGSASRSEVSDIAWVAPPAFTSGAVLTAAQLNILGNDLLETAPAKATAAGQLFVATGLNAIVARTPATASDLAGDTYTSTSYGASTTPGPAVTVTTGTTAFVAWAARIHHNVVGEQGMCDFEVSGATVRAPTDQTALRFYAGAVNQGARMGISRLVTGLTAGSNTFTLRYRTTASTATFADRVLTVIPF